MVRRLRYADPEAKDNQQDTVRKQTNMSARGQTRPCAHERSAFDTPPHFVHSWGTGTKCILHASRGKLSLFDVHGLGCGRRAMCGVAHVTHVMGHNMFMSTQVAALPPCSPPAAHPLDGPQDDDLWRFQSHIMVMCVAPR